VTPLQAPWWRLRLISFRQYPCGRQSWVAVLTFRRGTPHSEKVGFVNLLKARKRAPCKTGTGAPLFRDVPKNLRTAWGTVEYRDMPDVIITGAQTLGIEITNFYVSEGGNPSSEQVQRNHRAAGVSLAQSLSTNSGGTNIEITFSFNKAHPIQNVAAVAARISALAHKAKHWNNGQIRRVHYEDIPELDFVYLYARKLQYHNEPDPLFPMISPIVQRASLAPHRGRFHGCGARTGNSF
jgi:hypothetical protein